VKVGHVLLAGADPLAAELDRPTRSDYGVQRPPADAITGLDDQDSKVRRGGRQLAGGDQPRDPGPYDQDVDLVVAYSDRLGFLTHRRLP
jgi:hypothetical protein